MPFLSSKIRGESVVISHSAKGQLLVNGSAYHKCILITNKQILLLLILSQVYVFIFRTKAQLHKVSVLL